jgi:hypothetical protein
MIRFIKPGDIFMFKLNHIEGYGMGRIISDNIVGNIVEVFDVVLLSPEYKGDIDSLKRLMPPLILDSYSLFDRKFPDLGEWRIVGRQENFEPKNMDNVFFWYGMEGGRVKVDYLGNKTRISDKECELYPPCGSNFGDSILDEFEKKYPTPHHQT